MKQLMSTPVMAVQSSILLLRLPFLSLGVDTVQTQEKTHGQICKMYLSVHGSTLAPSGVVRKAFFTHQHG